MGLYERIRDIAKTKGYSINRLEQELGFARSSINKFNKNTPGADKIQSIADFLGVSTDCLMTGKEDTEQNKPVITPKDKHDIAKDLEQIMADMKSDKNGPLYFDGQEADETTLNLLKDAMETMLRQAKMINKEKHNPNKNKK